MTNKQKEWLKLGTEEQRRRNNLVRYANKSDNYTDGFCGRCGRKRTDCQKVIDSGIRCTQRTVWEVR